MELSLLKERCRCETCKTEFIALILGTETGYGIYYGEYVLYGKNGEMVYWNCLRDPVFEEVSHMVDDIVSQMTGTKIEHSTHFPSVFGICCDPASDGSVFRLTPYCSACGSKKVTIDAPVHPIKYLIVDVPSVTHNVWNQLSPQKKRFKLYTELYRNKP